MPQWTHPATAYLDSWERTHVLFRFQMGLGNPSFRVLQIYATGNTNQCAELEYIYSENYPSPCPLSRSSVVTKELLSKGFGYLQHLGTYTYTHMFSFITLPASSH